MEVVAIVSQILLLNCKVMTCRSVTVLAAAVERVNARSSSLAAGGWFGSDVS